MSAEKSEHRRVHIAATFTEKTDQLSRFQINAWYSVALLVLTAYAAFLLSLNALPFPDIPNHLTRAYIMGHIGESTELQQSFGFSPRFIPYFLGDWFLALLTRVLPLFTAGTVWVTALFLFFPFSVWYYLWSRGTDRESTLLILLLCPVFATGYYFLSGYHAYCLSVSLVFCALGFWENWQKPSTGTRLPLYFTFALLCLATYFTHLAGFVFLAAILGLSVLARLVRRSLTALGSVVSLTPCALLCAYHAAGAHLGASSGDVWIHRTFLQKVLTLSAMFIRFDYTFDTGIVIVFLGLLAVLIWSAIRDRNARGDNDSATLFELGIIIAGLTACYLILPGDMPPALEVDQRALPFACIFCCLFAVRAASASLRARWEIQAWCLALSVLNLVYISSFLLNANRELTEYVSALGRVPRGQHLVSISTRPPLGRLDIGTHQAELYNVLGGGIAPELFAENTAGDQFSYFRYLRDWYSPGRFWYQRKQDGTVRWDLIVSQYQYLIVTKPFDRERLKIARLNEIFSNSSATVFQIADPSGRVP
ncbi:MAG: hypothetical protein U0136_11885 [Bdellovibrionota bacterium]